MEQLDIIIKYVDENRGNDTVTTLVGKLSDYRFYHNHIGDEHPPVFSCELGVYDGEYSDERNTIALFDLRLEKGE